MLPEALSNHLCSLLPNEDRLAFAVVISFDRDGRVRRTRFFPAIIKSKRRFTYSEVNSILTKKRKDEEFAPILVDMEELSQLLNTQRKKRGSVDFDLPEPYFIIGLRGNIEEIVKKERNVAHEIIEEFMIAANEAVAGYLTKRGIPGLYRVHQGPDRQKIENFVKFAQGLGVEMEAPEDITAQWCQHVLEGVENLPQKYILNTMLLRSMQQAVYSPENTGHFGLASPDYLHFTSPIRRYPDLVVHRVLRANLKYVRKRPVIPEEQLKLLGEHCSKRERVAMEAEREMIDRLKVRFMAGKIGEVFEGIIISITSFGFFVELNEIFVDGAVRLVDLADDYYVHDSDFHRLVGTRTGKVFQVGDPVTVRLKAVNIPRRHINFEVIEPPEE
jgi:ribonuclease R